MKQAGRHMASSLFVYNNGCWTLMNGKQSNGDENEGSS